MSRMCGVTMTAHDLSFRVSGSVQIAIEERATINDYSDDTIILATCIGDYE